MDAERVIRQVDGTAFRDAQGRDETLDELEITIQATDGTGRTVTETISVLIGEENDAPIAPLASGTDTDALVTIPGSGPDGISGTGDDITIASSDLGVEQDADSVKTLYIKLQDLWSDDRDESRQLDFEASSSVSWIDIKYGPAEWEAIENDGVTWPSAEDATTRIIGADTNEPGIRDKVVILEIDRVNRKNQGDEGTFTLTATDTDDATGSRTYTVRPQDEAVQLVDDAVTLTGSAREGSTLRARFNDNEDPDLAGAATPALVLYQWFRVDAGGTEAASPFLESTSNSYTLTHEDVGSSIRVKVKYYDILSGALDLNDATTNTDDPDTPNIDESERIEATTPSTVANTPDRGSADITILASNDGLTVLNGVEAATDDPRSLANVRVSDDDYYASDNLSGAVPDTGLSVSWEESDNGRGGWTAVDDAGPGDGYNPTLTLKDGDGKYYRAVVSYNVDPNDTATEPAKETVVSDPIRVADVRDAGAPSLTPTITGSNALGGTLGVDAGTATVTVQWQRDADTGAGESWVNIPGAAESLSLTPALAGQTVRAVVSYQSRDPDNPGVTAVVVTNSQTIAGDAAGVRPVPVDDYEIEASVDGTGHGFFKAAFLSSPGHNATITHSVPLASLFQDPDTSNFLLRFSAAGADSTDTNEHQSNLGASTGGDGRTYTFEHAAGVMVLETRSGKLTYVSDAFQNHDGTSTDGDGNILTLNITANDRFGAPAGNSVTTGEVTLRINVAPTNITFLRDAEQPGTDPNNDVTDNAPITRQDPATTADGEVAFRTAYGTTDLAEIEIMENTSYEESTVVAVLDVQDENAKRHAFGTHEVTVSGDDRFMITKTGGEKVSRDADGDGSTWELRVVKGAEFDYETDDADGNPLNGVQIVLTFSATDGGGLSTPVPNSPTWLWEGFQASWLHQPIQLLVTITNDPDEFDPPRPSPTNTPGLKDDEDDDADDTKDDDSSDSGDHDSETDGGDPTPPPPGMSLGGIIEDFIDNMDQGEQDLLEDFLLTIDDGLDIV